MSDRPALTGGELFHKLLAVRTQLQLHEVERQLYIARTELAAHHARALTEGLPALEAQALADLDAPAGARFNWQTFTYDDAPAAPAPASVE
jgi:hypothetical protein